MSDGKGDLETEVDNSGPPHVERPTWQKKLAMSDENLKYLRNVLKLIRRISPAGENLTFEQALSLVRRNAEVYDRFLLSGAPITALEVRWGAHKELCRVIQNRADGVREVTFNRPLAEDTVLQLWRSGDMDFDEVPLLFLDLEEVPSQGFSRTELYLNGQKITLFVRKEENGEFSIKLSFAIDKEFLSDDEEFLEAEDERQETARNATSQGVSECSEDHTTTSSHPMYAAPPTNYSYHMRAAAMVLLVSLGAYFWGSYLATQKAKEDMLAENKSHAEAARKSEAARDNTAIASADHELHGATLVQTTGTETQQTVDPTPTTHATIRWRGELAFVEVPIYFEELNHASLDKESKIRVRAEFIKSLEGQGIKVCTEGKNVKLPDGIVRLRFELDKTADGTVFAEVRDKNCQYISSDKAGCDTTISGNLNTVFEDVSQRLGTLMVAAMQHVQLQRNGVEQQAASPNGHTGEGGQ
jgi:hypothetical protein